MRHWCVQLIEKSLTFLKVQIFETNVFYRWSCIVITCYNALSLLHKKAMIGKKYCWAFHEKKYIYKTLKLFHSIFISNISTTHFETNSNQYLYKDNSCKTKVGRLQRLSCCRKETNHVFLIRWRKKQKCKTQMELMKKKWKLNQI